MNTSRRQFLGSTSMVLAALLTACGGGSEPTVTVFAELNSNTVFSVWDDGTLAYLPSPGPGDSNIAEAALKAAGVRTSNRMCSRHTGRTSSGGYVDFIEGIFPVYVIFDIPESDLAKAQAVHYRKYFPEYSLVKPFWDCVASGY